MIKPRFDIALVLCLCVRYGTPLEAMLRDLSHQPKCETFLKIFWVCLSVPGGVPVKAQDIPIVFNLDFTVQGTTPGIFKLVHYEAHAVRMRATGIWLKCLLLVCAFACDQCDRTLCVKCSHPIRRLKIKGLKQINRLCWELDSITVLDYQPHTL